MFSKAEFSDSECNLWILDNYYLDSDTIVWEQFSFECVSFDNNLQ
jgi:hypothetical protein